MASTDIDSTPILILSALEAEHVAAMLKDNDAVDTTLLLFLCWLVPTIFIVTT